jgi:hypothetical protein
MSRHPPQKPLHETLPVGSAARSRLQAQLTPRLSHGGPKSVRRRKTARPWNPKAPVHLVLSSHRAKGAWSLQHRKHRAKVQALIYRYAERFKVRIYRASNVGNQLQLLVKASDRKQLADYLRVLAGRVAVTVTGAQKGIKRIGKFWGHLTYSRLVNWGKDFFSVRKLLEELQLTPLAGQGVPAPVAPQKCRTPKPPPEPG